MENYNCPVCGERVVQGLASGNWYIECKECGLELMHESKEILITLWNNLSKCTLFRK